MPEITVHQEKIRVGDCEFTATHIPTATSGSWFVVHDTCEIWAAVAIDDVSGEIIGWRNPPTKLKAEIENAVRKAFSISIPE